MQELVGNTVVIDVESLFVFVGTLSEVRDKTLILTNADVHDLRDSKTTRELYVLDSKVHGIRANRKRVLVPLHQVVSVSLLADVLQ
ncbi:MAG: hypothetical protein R3C19_19855 [Planctomycetaceae bacterium]